MLHSVCLTCSGVDDRSLLGVIRIHCFIRVIYCCSIHACLFGCLPGMRLMDSLGSLFGRLFVRSLPLRFVVDCCCCYYS